MSLHDKSLNDITEADLLSLVTGQVQEGRTVDYKLQLPGNSDADKREFRYDTCSFANALGGHLIFGVQETNGLPVTIAGLPGIDPDAEIQRLDSLAQTSVEPRIPRLQIRAIPLSNGAVVVIVRVPQSSVGPHFVSLDESKRFYSRNSAGKYSMSEAEIRAAYTSASAIAAIRLELESTLATMCIKMQHTLTAEEAEPALRSMVSVLPAEDQQPVLARLMESIAGSEMDVPIPRHRFLKSLVDELPLGTDVSASINIDTAHRLGLVNYLLAGSPDPKQIRTSAIRQATTIGALLSYDASSQTLQNSDMSQAMAELLQDVESYAGLYEQVRPWRGQLLAQVASATRFRAPSQLRTDQALLLWGLYRSQVRVYVRVAALYRQLLGWRQSPLPDADRLISANPIGPEMESAVQRETVTPEDVRRWSSWPQDVWSV